MKKNIAPLLIVCLLGSVFYLIIGWLVFDLLFGNYTESNTTHLHGFKKSADFNFPFLYLSCLSYAVLINIILLKSTIQTYGGAIIYCSIIGILIACMTDFFWYASTNFYSNFFVVVFDIIGAAISVGLLGAFQFLLIRKLNK